jgi:hypothetical protein
MDELAFSYVPFEAARGGSPLTPTASYQFSKGPPIRQPGAHILIIRGR